MQSTNSAGLRLIGRRDAVTGVPGVEMRNTKTQQSIFVAAGQTVRSLDAIGMTTTEEFRLVPLSILKDKDDRHIRVRAWKEELHLPIEGVWKEPETDQSNKTVNPKQDSNHTSDVIVTKRAETSR